ncbi:cytochrome P450 family protein [Heterostelium album PN500]|uniref:Cytochrome P450 family protein n=1 Tax=Heterostelium pallidum (strain ATCC 26659 / Pp 5 / PN500) TaxID=670386 RepID=D3BHM8_HETP5|nr:cytochrome P450 family protein [Heterostelium album PN500]EFA79205.1 cytochrome P450 family protein [Heterostelium album PN500]|eukprot:XP_020431326.1 cytochrome P450 family protein [Heterostelium album PN500]
MIDSQSIILGVLIWLVYLVISHLNDWYFTKNKYLPSGPSFLEWFANYLLNYYEFRKGGSVIGSDQNDDVDKSLFDTGSENTVLRWFKQYASDSYCVSFFGLPMLFTRDADIAREVLLTDSDNYEKPPDSSGVLIRLARDGILMAEGARWQRHRDILSVPFSPVNVRKMESTILAATKELIGNIERHSEIEVHSTMTSLTYDIIGMLSIGHKFSREGSTSNFDYILNEMIRPIRRLSKYIPLPSDRKLNKFISELEDLILDEIRSRQQQQQKNSNDNNNNKDLLDHLLNNKEEQLTQDELIGNIMTFLLAGHETSANALTFTLALLSKHPEIQEQLYEQLCGDKNIQNIPLLEWIILETLRLFPPAPMIGRTSKTECTIKRNDSSKDAWKLPPKSMILVSVYAMHRNESVWKQANQFIPNRWDGINLFRSKIYSDVVIAQTSQTFKIIFKTKFQTNVLFKLYEFKFQQSLF